MPTPTNLYDYYKGQGISLTPNQTVAQRFSLPGFADAAKASGYDMSSYNVNRNNGDMNSAILENLINKPTTMASTSVAQNTGSTVPVTPTINPVTPAPVVSTSTATRTSDTNLGNTINGLVQSQNPAPTQPTTSTTGQSAQDDWALNEARLRDSYTNSKTTIQGYVDELKRRRDEQIKQIEQDYTRNNDNLVKQQAGQSGSTNSSIVSMGGYLGNTGSGMGVMQNLADKHTDQLNQLKIEKDRAIQAAQSAFNDKDFENAQFQAKAAQALEKEILDQKNKFFDDVRAAKKDAITQRQDNITNAFKRISDFGVLDQNGINRIPKATLDDLDNNLGYFGAAKDLIMANQKSKMAKTQKESYDSAKAYLDIVSKMPAGSQLKLDNGEVLQGVGENEKYTISNATDNNGNVSVIYSNKQNPNDIQVHTLEGTLGKKVIPKKDIFNTTVNANNPAPVVSNPAPQKIVSKSTGTHFDTIKKKWVPN